MESNAAYAEAHGLYEQLTAAVSAVMVERPVDPIARICEILQPVAPVATGVAMPVATIGSRANQSAVPLRVRQLFEALDTNSDGSMTLAELQAGFEREFGQDFGRLAPHAKAAIPILFEEFASDVEGVGSALKIDVFSRVYAEILYKHFDEDANGKLQVGEAEKALKFLCAFGQRADVVLALPTPVPVGGLPFGWFWETFRAMD